MPKNIIICCDGTNNKFGTKNSNVVHLYSMLDNKPGQQIAFYDPGVGTLADTSFMSPLKKRTSVIFGSAFGRGMQKNVEEAYSFLMEKHEEGDKVFLYGFSRGAYTVRVLAGFIKMLGLLGKGNQNLISYAYEIYSDVKLKEKLKYEIAGKFKYCYGREINFHFMGLWDTVSSVGWVGNLHTYPYTSDNEDISTIRHALAIDERRTYFTNEPLGCGANGKIDVKEVWFAGVHSDVGGSYLEAESGLSKIALDWMVNESVNAGLSVSPSRYNQVVHAYPDEKGNVYYTPPNHKADAHESLTGPWRIAEAIPRSAIELHSIEKKKKTFIPWGRRRIIPEDSYLHRSVIDRQKDLDYKPSNLPESFKVEEYKKVKF